MKYKILDYLSLLLLFVSPVIFLTIKNFNNSYPLNFISTLIALIIVSILIFFFFKILLKKNI